MQVNSRSAAWKQGVAVVVVAAASVTALLYRMHAPFDRDTLDIQVEALHSHAAEAGLLVREARADRLAPGFVAGHARQLAENVRRAQEALSATPAQVRFASLQASAQALGAVLHARLQALALDGRAPRTRAFGFDDIAQRFDALHQRLAPGG